MPEFKDISITSQAPIYEGELVQIVRLGRIDMRGKKKGRVFGTDRRRAIVETDQGHATIFLYDEHEYTMQEAGYELKEGLCETPIPVMLTLQTGGKHSHGGWRVAQVQDANNVRKWHEVK